MHKLPSDLKRVLLSHALDMFPSRTRTNKTTVIRSLAPSLILDTVARIFEQAMDNTRPLKVRRQAFLSLNIIVDV